MKVNRYKAIATLIEKMVSTGQVNAYIAETLYTIVEEKTGVSYLDLHGISEKLEWVKDDSYFDKLNMAFFIAETHSHRPITVINFVKDYLTRINDIHGPIYDINAVVDALNGEG